MKKNILAFAIAALLIQPSYAAEAEYKKQIEELKKTIKANEDYIRAVDATVHKIIENAVELEKRIKTLEEK